MNPSSPVVARYLDQLAQGLADCGLPEEDRREIAREIESHLADAAAAGTPVADGMRRLGSPSDLARAYAVELLLRPAPPAHRALWRQASAVLVTLFTQAIAGALFLLGVVLAFAGVLGVVGALIGPWLPLEPTLRQGLPQLAVLIVSLVIGALGAVILRLVRLAWRIARARPRVEYPLPQETTP